MDPHTTITLTLIALPTLVTLGYVGSCAVWPFAACRRCSGGGKKRAPIGRVFRHCGRCGGTGHRLRLGRRAWNAWTRTQRARRAAGTTRPGLPTGRDH
ncbi:MAG TPA: hypothetical protein VGD67_26985 [Pseudonocardiaceae bacterium]